MRIVLLMIVFVLLIPIAYGLSYEDKPSISAYIVNTNHLKRGEQTIYVTIYNSAERKKVDYFDEKEAMFFSEREEMLFTAYNVELELIGNDFIEVKTPKQNISALPPLQPIDVPFVIEVKESAKAGKYSLKLKAKFDVIDCLSYLEFYSPQLVPVQKVVQGGNETVTYEYKSLTESYKIRYKKVEEEIELPVYVDEKGVKLEIVNVTTENAVGKGKAKITILVKNVGEKTGRNCYLVLETPTGFKASAVGISTTPSKPLMPSAMPSMPLMPSMPTIPTQPTQTTPSSKPSYYIGDFKPNEIAKAVFYLKVDVKDEGNYTFKLKAVYLDEYGKTKESDSVPFGIHIAKAPEFDIKSVKSTVFVNTKGTVTVEFVPSTDLKDVSVYLTAKSPLSVLSSEYYLGDLKAGEVYKAIFKVKASDEAKPITYPADLVFKYKSLNEYFESDPIRIGIKVNPKIEFEVHHSQIPRIPAGSERIVEFVITNRGNFTVRDAVARLTIVDPFSSTDDTAYIGTLKPGESKVVKFKLSVDADATPKLYGLNLEVKYRDPEGEWAISEPVKAVIEVTKPTIPYHAIAILVIVLVVIAYVYRRYKK